MTASVALLTVSESALAEPLRSRIEARGTECRVLDVDAPFHQKPVTIGPRHVFWEGIDLLALGALFLELPLFPWPQPVRFANLSRDANERMSVIAAERESRSLILSAIRIAGDAMPAVNPPRRSHFAVLPATALDVAARAGLPVVPWRFGPKSTSHANELVMNPVRDDGLHALGRSGEEDVVLSLQAPEGPVSAMLIVGDKAVAGVGYGHSRGWISGERLSSLPDVTQPRAVLDSAEQAAKACGLPLAEIVVSHEATPRIVFIDAAPDLTAWGERTHGSVLDALADHLIRSIKRGGTS